MSPVAPLLVALAYLAGSVSSAIMVSRAMGLADPRTVGSGNPGATNVLRHSGRKAAALTLAGDLLKGLVPVLLGQALGLAPAWLAAVGTAAFLGHLFPVFFGFRGGKGVATYIGVLLGYGWPLGLAFVLAWLATAAAFRYSSLAALVAATTSPVVAVAFGIPPPVVGAMTGMVALLVWRHRSNIRNLLAGAEDRIGQRGDA